MEYAEIIKRIDMMKNEYSGIIDSDVKKSNYWNLYDEEPDILVLRNSRDMEVVVFLGGSEFYFESDYQDRFGFRELEDLLAIANAFKTRILKQQLEK